MYSIVIGKQTITNGKDRKCKLYMKIIDGKLIIINGKESIVNVSVLIIDGNN